MSYVYQLEIDKIEKSRLQCLWHVHIPKTGGNYIKKVFHRAVPKNIKVGLAALPLVGDKNPILFGNGHSEAISHSILDKPLVSVGNVDDTYTGEPFGGDMRKGYRPSYNAHSLFYKCFSFSTIRNPFDMLPSIFFYNLKNHPSSENLIINTFEEFVHNFCGSSNYFSDSRRYNEMDKNYVLSSHSIFKRFLFFQLFSHDTVCQVDAILPIEKIENGLRELFKNTDYLKDLNIDSVPVQPTGGTIREHKDYRKYYTTDLVDIVNSKFKREIEFFGYDFEDGYKSDVTIIDPSTFTYDIKYDLLIYSHDRTTLFPQWSHSVASQAKSYRDSKDSPESEVSHMYTPGLLKNMGTKFNLDSFLKYQNSISYEYDHMRASIWPNGKAESTMFYDGPASFETRL